MELSELIKVLESKGYSIDYGAAKAGVKAPFLVYIGAGASTLLADNTIYNQVNHYDIEYYFEDKNPKLERKLEQTLLEAGVIYSKSEDIDLEENELHYIVYSI